MKRIQVHEEWCIGCRLCEVHCVVRHSRSRHIIKAFHESPRALPRLAVQEQGALSFALPCRHCVDAPCVEACISGAMHLDAQSGAVLCDEERCVGCWTCVMVCPLGVAQRDEVRQRVASKCDLCAGQAIPACVAHCPNEALELTDVLVAPIAQKVPA